MTAPPRLTSAVAPLTRELVVRDEYGEERRISIPAERALTVFVDNRNAHAGGRPAGDPCR